jgi:hypothetical protein
MVPEGGFPGGGGRPWTASLLLGRLAGRIRAATGRIWHLLARLRGGSPDSPTLQSTAEGARLAAGHRSSSAVGPGQARLCRGGASLGCGWAAPTAGRTSSPAAASCARIVPWVKTLPDLLWASCGGAVCAVYLVEGATEVSVHRACRLGRLRDESPSRALHTASLAFADVIPGGFVGALLPPSHLFRRSVLCLPCFSFLFALVCPPRVLLLLQSSSSSQRLPSRLQMLSSFSSSQRLPGRLRILLSSFFAAATRSLVDTVVSFAAATWSLADMLGFLPVDALPPWPHPLCWQPLRGCIFLLQA